MKWFSKHIILFIVGGSAYYIAEILWRGYSHWSMFILGGLCFVLIGGLNNWFTWDMSLLKQGIIGAATITFLEFCFGVVLNLWLGLHIWDYSNLPFNIYGQICPQFTLLWVVLSTIAVVVDDWLRCLLFNEERPRYKFISN